MARSIFLIKSEPSVYAFDQLASDKKTMWEGVRNFEARNTLRAMKKGDVCLFYHSNEGKEIVGIAKVVREAYQDPTTDEDWSVVDVAPVKKLKVTVPLATIKEHPLLSKMEMIRRNRLSVTKVTEAELAAVLALGNTKL
jgi:predicted RNA-binding protein with PUA-like domain